jgi:uncharacterized membrane protein (DUF485 family)
MAAVRGRPADEPLLTRTGAPYGVVTRITWSGGSVSTAQEEGTVFERTQESPDFQELRRRFRSFAFPMTVAFLAWYLLYVVLSGWARDFMGAKVVGHINVALVFGILQFVSTFLIAWLYARHANNNLDALADKIRGEVEGETE